ncbi:hypothetical protein A7D21_18440 [Pseudomonas sp. AP19]|uniref:hypothetical protein n=1 Tax=Pseudomonas TaxID=286 RepID=UPI00084B0398|nr:hypothetical protein [Pseudomonas sp. AP19]OEC68595.1 hypothetical protein A7D21_18440 [Pseudomonas sp. AP19]
MSRLASLLSNQLTSELMEDSAVFITTVSRLVVDDLVAQEGEGENRPLDGFRIDGLMRGLSIVADALSRRGAWLKSEVQLEGETLEALARPQGKAALDSTKARKQS